MQHYTGGVVAATARFNPHPVRRPDATWYIQITLYYSPVSILIRSEDRMQRIDIFHLRFVDAGFNPHPVRRPDATYYYPLAKDVRKCFNPHPVRRPDATLNISISEGIA